MINFINQSIVLVDWRNRTERRSGRTSRDGQACLQRRVTELNLWGFHTLRGL